MGPIYVWWCDLFLLLCGWFLILFSSINQKTPQSSQGILAEQENHKLIDT